MMYVADMNQAGQRIDIESLSWIWPSLKGWRYDKDDAPRKKPRDLIPTVRIRLQQTWRRTGRTYHHGRGEGRACSGDNGREVAAGREEAGGLTDYSVFRDRFTESLPCARREGGSVYGASASGPTHS